MKQNQQLDLDKAEKFIQQITKKAGDLTKKYYGKIGVAYTKQNKGDVVTKADLLSNNLIVNAIKKNYPTHGIISEELKAENANAEYVWVIDPLDGTRNYSTKTPMYGVIVALAHKKKVIMGAISIPILNEMYFAREGKGAYMNGKRIHCSNTTELEHSYGTEGGSQNPQVAYVYLALIEQSKKTPLWINGVGSAAFSSILVASGRRDWVVNPSAGGCWDYAGPSIILKEAGCKVTTIEGKEWTIDEKSIIAANAVLHEKLLSIIKKAK